jgi:quinol monooxygenase YgiN
MPSVIATIKVKEDKIEEAKKLFAQLSAGVLADEPGTLAYIPHQRKDQPATFIFYEKYQDMEAFKAHGANLAKKGKEFAGVMAGPPEIVMVDELP